MSTVRPLQGACSCGRNHYIVTVPEDATEQALVYFDDSSESRRSQATPLTAWLRVPLTWYSSATTSYFPDETHTSIRRTFTPQHTPSCRRVFCGYCGTHLSFWTEQPPAEAEYMNITLGSLTSEDLEALQELDLLPEDAKFENISDLAQHIKPAGVRIGDDIAMQAALREENQPVMRTQQGGRSESVTWFDEMLDGSRLGRTQKIRRGLDVSRNGSAQVEWHEWEVTEYIDDSTEAPRTPGGSKRKIDEVAKDDDVSMQH